VSRATCAHFGRESACERFAAFVLFWRHPDGRGRTMLLCAMCADWYIPERRAPLPGAAALEVRT